MTRFLKIILSYTFGLLAVLPAYSQQPERQKVPNYILRNTDFIERRIGDSTLNFAKEYARATRQLHSAFSAKKGQDEWVPLGPLGEENLAGTGRINSMYFHPSDTNIWYICVAQGGIWKTVNAGASWISISGDLPILRTSSMVVDPSNPDIMYVALGDYAYLGHNLLANENKRNSHYGLGIYKTRNGGINWIPTALTFDQLDFEGTLISKIIIHPLHTDSLIAVGESGAYITADGGASWQQTSSKLFWSLQNDAANPDVLFASTGYVHSYGVGEAGIMKSEDFGQTWTEIKTTIPKTGVVQRIELAIAPSDNQVVYAIACDTIGGFYGFYKSVNAGLSFSQVLTNQYKYNILNWEFDATQGGQGRYDLSICVDRYDKEHVLIGGINIWQTHDGGMSFNPVTFWRLNYYNQSLHSDIHEIQQHPTNNSIFACHDGGISRSFKLYDEEPDSLLNSKVNTEWVNYTKGLNITSFYRLSINEFNTKEKIAGAQDNSTVFTDGSTFSNLSGGDGMESAFIDEQDYRYSSSQYGTIYTFQMSGGIPYYQGRLINPIDELGEWTTPMMVANNELYVLYENLYSYIGRYSTGKYSEFIDTKDGYPRTGTALDIEKSNGNRIYLAKRGYASVGIQNQIWTSPDKGNNWIDIGAGLPRNYYPSYIEMSQLNPNKVWISFSAFDSLNKVFYSEDAGKNWVNITLNLPNIPVNCIAHQEDGTNLIYAGTDNGVYYLKKGSSTWEYYSHSLPKVIVSELEIDTTSHTLVAATFGRGLWEVGLVDYDSVHIGLESLVFRNTELYVYPNPTRSQLEITGNFTLTSDAELKLIDITGKVVYQETLHPDGGGTMAKHLDISTLKPGEYFVLLTSNTERKSTRFIKY